MKDEGRQRRTSFYIFDDDLEDCIENCGVTEETYTSIFWKDPKWSLTLMIKISSFSYYRIPFSTCFIYHIIDSL